MSISEPAASVHDETATLLERLTATIGPDGTRDALARLLGDVDEAVAFLALCDHTAGLLSGKRAALVPVERAESAVLALRQAMGTDELRKAARIILGTPG